FERPHRAEAPGRGFGQDQRLDVLEVVFDARKAALTGDLRCGQAAHRVEGDWQRRGPGQPAEAARDRIVVERRQLGLDRILCRRVDVDIGDGEVDDVADL